MIKILSISDIRKNANGYIIDILAILSIYFIPTLSHLTEIPFYLFEPMRLFIILALLHSNKLNTYILAVSLPLFSYAIASHPYFLKSLIMAVELVLNVYLFHLFIKQKMAVHLSVLFSIIVSKLMYYLLKFLLIHFMFIQSELISTPIYIQVILIMIFSIYAYLIIKKMNLKKGL
jgi:hypothetical protein